MRYIADGCRPPSAWVPVRGASGQIRERRAVLFALEIDEPVGLRPRRRTGGSLAVLASDRSGTDTLAAVRAGSRDPFPRVPTYRHARERQGPALERDPLPEFS